MKIAQGSKSWIASAFLFAIIFLVIYFIFLNTLIGVTSLLLSIIFFLKTGFLLTFFRDPERKIGNGFVVCADGKIREITKTVDEDIGNCFKISTFMNVHNVHVNRMPLDGVIKNIVHISGLHLPAFKKESEKNERVIITFDSSIGTVKIVQIAGTIARRIVPYIQKGDKLKKGTRIGIIRLGSRVDVFLPSSKIKKLLINVGDVVKAGVDTIAEIND